MSFHATLPKQMAFKRLLKVIKLHGGQVIVKPSHTGLQLSRKVLLVQPSSAAAERIFSVMESLFNKQQDSALEETVEASVMLSFNGSQQRKCKL